MHQKIIKDITPFSRFIITFLLIAMLFVTNSIYLILFINVLLIYLLLLIGKSVNFYIKIIKNYLFLLLFFLLLYIIISRNSLYLILIFFYKYVISVLFIICFLESLDFSELHSIIYRMLKPLKKLKLNVGLVSFDATLYLCYINYLFNAKYEIYRRQQLKNKKNHNFKYLILPILIQADNQTRNLSMNLKVNHYKLMIEKKNKKSLFIILFFIILFIITVVKEVIL